MFRRVSGWQLVPGLLLVVCFGAMAARANTLELELISGGASSGVVVGAPCGGGLSCVQFNGMVGLWNINLASGTSAGPSVPIMDLSSINATSTAGAASLTILLTDTFTSPDSTFLLSGSGNLVSGSGTASYSAYFDSGNTLFAGCDTAGGCTASDLIGTLGTFSAGYAAGPTAFTVNGVPSFSLTEAITLTNSGPAVMWSTDSSIQGVPEPTVLSLLGTGGLFLLFARRRLSLTA